MMSLEMAERPGIVGHVASNAIQHMKIDIDIKQHS